MLIFKSWSFFIDCKISKISISVKDSGDWSVMEVSAKMKGLLSHKSDVKAELKLNENYPINARFFTSYLHTLNADVHHSEPKSMTL